jgi:hypothetical protein
MFELDKEQINMTKNNRTLLNFAIFIWRIIINELSIGP